MLQINRILNYIGLRAPSSPREALKNIQKNIGKIIAITSTIALGIVGIFANKLCNHLTKSTTTPPSVNLSTDCIIGIASYNAVCCIIVNGLGISSFTLALKPTFRKNLKKTYWNLTKGVFFLSIVVINASITTTCIIQTFFEIYLNTTACSLTSPMAALTGSSLILFTCNDLLSILLPINLPALPEPIEITLLTPLEEEIDHPQQPVTTELLDLLGQVDQIFSHLLNHAIDDSIMIEEDVQLILNKALLLFQKIDSIFLRKLAHYGQYFLLEINELSVMSKSIIFPLQLEHNIISISTILGKLHTLIRNLVALHPITVPIEIRLALPSFQALCPPPEYTEKQTSSMNTSTVLTLPSLYLASPPSYEENSEIATTSF
ncbi:hypothetical protein [Candidatus Clavichlamydia salmonicola]|uniref:hypothetical protein n=1 Tax=Candidatus Clavichlamydia salmonicola TaxID=469812 RepID=UPI001891D39E|nr:hypothetical protein [Candidatus Clavichlamydia salmonicola]